MSRSDDERDYQSAKAAVELEERVPLSAAKARQDLNEAGYFHVQPCSCEKCTL